MKRSIRVETVSWRIKGRKNSYNLPKNLCNKVKRFFISVVLLTSWCCLEVRFKVMGYFQQSLLNNSVIDFLIELGMTFGTPVYLTNCSIVWAMCEGQSLIQSRSASHWINHRRQFTFRVFGKDNYCIEWGILVWLSMKPFLMSRRQKLVKQNV